MEVRRVKPEEYDILGEITVRAYRELFGGHSLGSYETELLNVGSRDDDSEVFVAVDDENRVVGGVTYVPGVGRIMSEFTDPDAAGIRMLAVDPARQGAGAGFALTNWCVDRAKTAGRRRVVLHSTPVMTVAHGLYRRLGFVRSPELDEWVEESPDAEEPLHLMSFTLEL
jgi:ribosomal protein S18 acetylase RimI-like enzyme